MISHPDKLLFPDDGITKGELAEYYTALAPLMLPHLVARPITMERFPAGIGKPGFLQKTSQKGSRPGSSALRSPKKVASSTTRSCAMLDRCCGSPTRTASPPHVWTSRAPDLYQPDLCVFDLDPSEDEPDVLRRAALQVRDVLHELGLLSWIKTSGSKGFHIVVPLDGTADFEAVTAFGNAVGAAAGQA